MAPPAPAPRATAALSRRLVLRGALAAAALAPARGWAQAAGRAPEAVVLAVSDLHSGWRQTPRLLSALRAVRARFAGVPAVFVVNGDLFERGNRAALRSGGGPDWAFLAALAAEAPVLMTLGNHELALEDDLAAVVARAEGLGVQPVGGVIDARRGRFFAPVSARLGLGGRRLAALALAPDNPRVWRAAVRDALTLPDPVALARDAGPGAFAGADFPLLLSHAGLRADKRLLAGLPEGAAVIGGHSHVSFAHAEARLGYAHCGAWGTHLTLGLLRAGEPPRLQVLPAADLADRDDPALAETVAATLAAHLDPEDREVLAHRETDLDLPASILLAAEAVRAAVGADAALLGHTTFGQPLAAGPLTRHDFDAYLRFDGKVMTAQVPAETLAVILSRANQHRAVGLDARTGDYAHATEVAIAPGRTYRLAVNDWLTRNQRAYLGVEGLDFAEVPGLSLRAVVLGAL